MPTAVIVGTKEEQGRRWHAAGNGLLCEKGSATWVAIGSRTLMPMG